MDDRISSYNERDECNFKLGTVDPRLMNFEKEPKF